MLKFNKNANFRVGDARYRPIQRVKPIHIRPFIHSTDVKDVRHRHPGRAAGDKITADGRKQDGDAWCRSGCSDFFSHFRFS